MRGAVRCCAYLWAFPVTALALPVGLLARLTGGSWRLRGGVLEVEGGFAAWLLHGNRFWRGGAAMTLGHVILAGNEDCLDRSRAHELVHVRQFERWGPFLLPAAWLIGRWLWLRGYHPYLDHPFERRAGGAGLGTDR